MLKQNKLTDVDGLLRGDGEWILLLKKIGGEDCREQKWYVV